MLQQGPDTVQTVETFRFLAMPELWMVGLVIVPGVIFEALVEAVGAEQQPVRDGGDGPVAGRLEILRQGREPLRDAGIARAVVCEPR